MKHEDKKILNDFVSAMDPLQSDITKQKVIQNSAENFGFEINISREQTKAQI